MKFAQFRRVATRFFTSLLCLLFSQAAFAAQTTNNICPAPGTTNHFLGSDPLHLSDVFREGRSSDVSFVVSPVNQEGFKLLSPDQEAMEFFLSRQAFPDLSDVNRDPQFTEAVSDLQQQIGLPASAALFQLLQHYERWESQIGEYPDFSKISKFEMAGDPLLAAELGFSTHKDLRRALFEDFVPRILDRSVPESEKLKLISKLMNVASELGSFYSGVGAEQTLEIAGLANLFTENELTDFAKFNAQASKTFAESSLTLAEARRWFTTMARLRATLSLNDAENLAQIRGEILRALGADPKIFSNPADVRNFLAKIAPKQILSAMEALLGALQAYAFSKPDQPKVNATSQKSGQGVSEPELSLDSEDWPFKVVNPNLHFQGGATSETQRKIEQTWNSFKRVFQASDQDVSIQLLVNWGFGTELDVLSGQESPQAVNARSEKEVLKRLQDYRAKLSDAEFLKSLQNSLVNMDFSAGLRRLGFYRWPSQESAFYQAPLGQLLREEFITRENISSEGKTQKLNWKDIVSRFAGDAEMKRTDARGYTVGNQLADPSGKVAVNEAYFTRTSTPTNAMFARDLGLSSTNRLETAEVMQKFRKDKLLPRLPLPSLGELKNGMWLTYQPTKAYIDGKDKQMRTFSVEDRQRFILAEQVSGFTFAPTSTHRDATFRIDGGVPETHAFLLNQWGSDTLEALTLLRMMGSYGKGLVNLDLKIEEIRKQAQAIYEFENRISEKFRTLPHFHFANFQEFEKKSAEYLARIRQISFHAPGVPFDVLGLNSERKYELDLSSFDLKPARLTSDVGLVAADPTAKALTFGVGQKDFMTELDQMEKKLVARKNELKKKLQATSGAPSLKDLDAWTLPQLEALSNLVRLYGFDGKAFSGEKSGWISIRDEMAQFDPKNLGQSRSLLLASQLASQRIPYFLGVYGDRWHKYLGVDSEEENIPLPILIERMAGIVEVEAALKAYAVSNLGFNSINRQSGLPGAPTFVKEVNDRREALVRVLRLNRVILPSANREQEDRIIERLGRLVQDSVVLKQAAKYGVDISHSKLSESVDQIDTPEALRKVTLSNRQRLEDLGSRVWEKFGLRNDPERAKHPKIQFADPARKGTTFDIREKALIVSTSEMTKHQAGGLFRARLLSDETFYSHIFDEPFDEAGAYFGNWFGKKDSDFEKEYKDLDEREDDTGTSGKVVRAQDKDRSAIKPASLFDAKSRAALDFMGFPITSSFLDLVQSSEFEPTRTFLASNADKFFQNGRRLFQTFGQKGGLTRAEFRKLVQKFHEDPKIRALIIPERMDAFDWDKLTVEDAELLLGERWREANDETKRQLREQLTCFKRFIISANALLAPTDSSGANLADIAGLGFINDVYYTDPKDVLAQMKDSRARAAVEGVLEMDRTGPPSKDGNKDVSQNFEQISTLFRGDGDTKSAAMFALNEMVNFLSLGSEKRLELKDQKDLEALLAKAFIDHSFSVPKFWELLGREVINHFENGPDVQINSKEISEKICRVLRNLPEGTPCSDFSKIDSKLLALVEVVQNPETYKNILKLKLSGKAEDRTSLAEYLKAAITPFEARVANNLKMRAEAQTSYLMALTEHWAPARFQKVASLDMPLAYIPFHSSFEGSNRQAAVERSLTHSFQTGMDKFAGFLWSTPDASGSLKRGDYRLSREDLILRELFGTRGAELLKELPEEEQRALLSRVRDLSNRVQDLEKTFQTSGTLSREQLAQVYRSELLALISNSSRGGWLSSGAVNDQTIREVLNSLNLKPADFNSEELLKQLQILAAVFGQSGALILSNLGWVSDLSLTQVESGLWTLESQASGSMAQQVRRLLTAMSYRIVDPKADAKTSRSSFSQTSKALAYELHEFSLVSDSYGFSPRDLTTAMQKLYQDEDLRLQYEALMDRMYKAESPVWWGMERVGLGMGHFLGGVVMAYAGLGYRWLYEVPVLDLAMLGDYAFSLENDAGRGKLSDNLLDTYERHHAWGMSGFDQKMYANGNTGTLAAFWGMDALSMFTLGQGAVIKGSAGGYLSSFIRNGSRAQFLLSAGSSSGQNAAKISFARRAFLSARSLPDAAMRAATAPKWAQQALKSLEAKQVKEVAKIQATAERMGAAQVLTKELPKTMTPDFGRKSQVLRFLESVRKQGRPIAKNLTVQTIAFSGGQILIDLYSRSRMKSPDSNAAERTWTEAFVDNGTTFFNNAFFFAAMAMTQGKFLPMVAKWGPRSKWMATLANHTFGQGVHHYMQREILKSTIEAAAGFGFNQVLGPDGKPKSAAELGNSFWNNMFLLTFMVGNKVIPKTKYGKYPILRDLFQDASQVQSFRPLYEQCRQMLAAGVPPSEVYAYRDLMLKPGPNGEDSPIRANYKKQIFSLNPLKMFNPSEYDLQQMEKVYRAEFDQGMRMAMESLAEVSPVHKSIDELLSEIKRIHDIDEPANAKADAMIDLLAKNPDYGELLFLRESRRFVRDEIETAQREKAAGRPQTAIPISEKMTEAQWAEFLRRGEEVFTAQYTRPVQASRTEVSEVRLGISDPNQPTPVFATETKVYSADPDPQLPPGGLREPPSRITLHLEGANQSLEYGPEVDVKVYRSGSVVAEDASGWKLRMEFDPGTGVFLKAVLFRDRQIQEFSRFEDLGNVFQHFHMTATSGGQSVEARAERRLTFTEVTGSEGYTYRDANGNKQTRTLTFREVGPQDHRIREAVYEDGSRIVEFEIEATNVIRQVVKKKLRLKLPPMRAGRYFSIDPEAGIIWLETHHGRMLEIDTRKGVVRNKTFQERIETVQQADGTVRKVVRTEEQEKPFPGQASSEIPLEKFVKISNELLDVYPFPNLLDLDLSSDMGQVSAARNRSDRAPSDKRSLSSSDISKVLDKVHLAGTEEWRKLGTEEERLSLLLMRRNEFNSQVRSLVEDLRLKREALDAAQRTLTEAKRNLEAAQSSAGGAPLETLKTAVSDALARSSQTIQELKAAEDAARPVLSESQIRAPAYDRLIDYYKINAFLVRLGLNRESLKNKEPEARWDLIKQTYRKKWASLGASVLNDPAQAHTASGLNEARDYFEKNKDWE